MVSCSMAGIDGPVRGVPLFEHDIEAVNSRTTTSKANTCLFVIDFYSLRGVLKICNNLIYTNILVWSICGILKKLYMIKK